jgi:carbamoyltransferase
MRGPVLGIGGSNHDFSAAIVRDGEIAVAIEDERVQRVKQARTEWHAHPARDSVAYCLEAIGLGLGDLIGVYCCDDLERPRAWLDWSTVRFVNHHSAHAAASFFASPHPRATLLVVDGHGSPLGEAQDGYQVETISAGWADGTAFTLEPLQTGVQQKTSSAWRYVADNSIGWFYEIVTMAIGFGDSGQGKTMGLAAYGEATLLGELRGFVEIGPDGRFAFDPYGGIDAWLADTMARRRDAMQVRADIAYAAQEIFVDAIVAAAREAHRRASSPVLCFGGGCALNTLANSRILETTPFEQVFVFPAAGDNGLSVGAAYYGAHVDQGQPRAEPAPGWRGRAVYTGRRYAAEEVDAALARTSVVASRPSDLAQETACALAAGETVAVCRDGAEIGPRALGNRSMLALPSSARMRDHINLNIKQRESFRPLAPVVPAEHVATYFEGVEESPYMLLVARVAERFRSRLAAVTHVDGTARVQTVRAEDNPFLHRVLELIGETTGVPVLVNTSLNLRGQPIVETPGDAIDLFVRCPLDALVLGDRLVRKYSPWVAPSQLAGALPWHTEHSLAQAGPHG